MRVSPAIRVKSVRTDSSRSCSSTRVPVGPPANPVAITGLPSRLRARATLIPLPPATVRLSTARWRRPRRKLGTATVRSIAALRVTVRITLRLLRTSLSLISPWPSAPERSPKEGRSNQYHEQGGCGENFAVRDEAPRPVEQVGLGDRAPGAQGCRSRRPSVDEDRDAAEDRAPL